MQISKYKIIILICLIIILICLIILLINKYRSDSIFTYIDQNKVNEIHQLLKYIHCTFTKTNTKYTIIGGTLLGCIRHKGLIPWDNDADIAVLNKSFTEILEILKPLEKNKIVSYMNIYNGIIKVKFKHSNTIIDIFILQKDKDDIYRFTPPYDTRYPNEYFREYELYPLKIYNFGPLELYGPNLPINYLDRVYPNWDNTAEAWVNEIDRNYNSIKSTDINLTISANPTITILKQCN